VTHATKQQVTNHLTFTRKDQTSSHQTKDSSWSWLPLTSSAILNHKETISDDDDNNYVRTWPPSCSLGSLSTGSNDFSSLDSVDLTGSSPLFLLSQSTLATSQRRCSHGDVMTSELHNQQSATAAAATAAAAAVNQVGPPINTNYIYRHLGLSQSLFALDDFSKSDMESNPSAMLNLSPSVATNSFVGLFGQRKNQPIAIRGDGDDENNDNDNNDRSVTIDNVNVDLFENIDLASGEVQSIRISDVVTTVTSDHQKSTNLQHYCMTTTIASSGPSDSLVQRRRRIVAAAVGVSILVVVVVIVVAVCMTY